MCLLLLFSSYTFYYCSHTVVGKVWWQGIVVIIWPGGFYLVLGSGYLHYKAVTGTSGLASTLQMLRLRTGPSLYSLRVIFTQWHLCIDVAKLSLLFFLFSCNVENKSLVPALPIWSSLGTQSLLTINHSLTCMQLHNFPLMYVFLICLACWGCCLQVFF